MGQSRATFFGGVKLEFCLGPSLGELSGGNWMTDRGALLNGSCPVRGRVSRLGFLQKKCLPRRPCRYKLLLPSRALPRAASGRLSASR